MYIPQLESFRAVVETGSYTVASRNLHLSQPAVSQHIRSLEQGLGVALLQRVGGRMLATEAGLIVYHRCVSILSEYHALRDEVASLRGLHAGRVVFGAGISVGSYVLPRIVAQFRRDFPDVDLKMMVQPAPNIFDSVQRGVIDFGISFEFEVPETIHAERLYRDQLVLVVGADHPLIDRWKRGIPRAALRNLPLIALADEEHVARRLSAQWLAAHGLEVKIEMVFDSWEAIRSVVSAGYGAAFFLGAIAGKDLAAGRLHTLPLEGPPVYIDYVLATRRQSRLSPATSRFLKHLIAGLKQEQLVLDVNDQALSALSRPGRRAPRSQPNIGQGEVLEPV
jgi:DNA-binding transcriptional LysR family regulator